MHNRPLRHMERMVAVANDAYPLNAVIALRLSRTPPFETMREALDALQARYPALRVRIDPSGGYRFKEDVNRPVPLEVIEGNIDTWPALVEKHLNQAFDSKPGPLLHLSVLADPDKAPAVLVFTFHHAIMDGRSAILLLDAFLRHIGGLPIKPFPSPAMPAITDRFPPSFKGGWKAVSLLRFLGSEFIKELRFTANHLRHPAMPVPPRATSRILTMTLSEGETQALVRRSRRSSLALHSVLQAALAMATQRVLFGGGPRLLRLIAFADLRPYLEPPLEPGILGNAISMLRITEQPGAGDTAWDFAGRVQRAFSAAFRRGDKFASYLLADRLVELVLRIKKVRLGTTALSYSGNPGLQENFGEYRLESLNAFISNNRFGPVITAQMQLFREQLVVDLLYLAPEVEPAQAGAILEEMKSLLSL